MDPTGGYDSHPAVADLYDHTVHYATRGDARFYVDLAGRVGGRVLELGCGTGRVLVPIAEAGHPVLGMDLSERMLTRCRAKVAALPPEARSRVRLLNADMTRFQLSETFDLAIFPFRSFQHLLSVEDQLNCLRCVNRHLQLGGVLGMDLFHVDYMHFGDPSLHKERTDFKDVALPDGRRFTRSQRVAEFHPDEQYNDIELIHTVSFPDGRTERIVQSFPWRHFFRYEVVHLLHRCGFRVTDTFGDYDRSPLRKDSPEMIFVAEKLEDACPLVRVI